MIASPIPAAPMARYGTVRAALHRFTAGRFHDNILADAPAGAKGGPTKRRDGVAKRETKEKGAAVPDFGRGSREQTQGGPGGKKENVEPIRKPADAARRRG